MSCGKCGSVVLLLVVVGSPVPAADLTLPPLILRDRGDTDELEPRKLILPYVFATETLGVAGGVGAGASAWPREQVAPLQGADWVRFLNAACRRCHFAEDALSRPESAPEQMLLDNAARWIRGHVVHSPKMAIRHV